MSNASTNMSADVETARERMAAQGRAFAHSEGAVVDDTETARMAEPAHGQSLRNRAQAVAFEQLFTVERALYGLLLLLAALWRGWALGGSPLSSWEAANSWPAWLIANGERIDAASTPNSPIFFGLQWLLFWLGLDGEWAARLVGVVAGVALVGLAWWWRAWLSRPGALVLALLLAINPWATALSRMADGAGLSLLLGMAVLTALITVVAEPGANGVRWLCVGAAAMGLLVVSGPLGLNLLPVLLFGVWLWRGELAEANVRPRDLLWWLVGSAVLGGSFFFVRLDGLAWMSSSANIWLAQFGGPVDPAVAQVIGTYDAGWLLARVLAEGVLPLVLGLVGLAATWRAKQRGSDMVGRWAILMGAWLLWALLLNLLPGRSPFSLGVFILPLLLLAAPVVVNVVQLRPRDVPMQELGAVVVTLLILLVSAIFWATALGANQVFDAVVAQATAVILALALAILLAFGVWSRRQNAGWVAVVLVFGLMALAHLRAGWLLSQATIEEPAGWQVTTGHPEVMQLGEDITTLSAQTEGDPYQLPVHIELASYRGFDGAVIPAHRDPLLGWVVRHMNTVTWGELPATDDSPGVVISVAMEEEGDVPPLPAHYTGSEYDVAYHWSPSELGHTVEAVDGSAFQRVWQTRVQPWWRWLVYRQSDSAPTTRSVVMWAPRSGVAQGQ